jgi:murein L,D-transpeptidase YafK
VATWAGIAGVLGALVPSAAAGVGLAAEGATAVARASTLPEEERWLLLALEAIADARLDDAEAHLEALLARHPTFRLARLLQADVLMARSGRFVDFASGGAGARVDMLRAEAMARLANARNADVPGRQPESLLHLAPSQRRVVVVDVSAARMYVYANRDGVARLERSYYVSTGKNGAAKRREGDQRTPLGVYFITGRIDNGALPDFYGPGALPVNYPNEWDLRLGRTGYGIWIHGVPSDTFARAPRASDGCMALSNEHASELLRLPQPQDTPVIIADGLRWLDARDLETRRAELAATLEAWRRDWESLDVTRYARHYAGDFRGDDRDRGRWMAQKRRVNASKRYIRVELEDVSMFAYPGERDLVVVSFEQNYRSDNFVNRARKRQYWRREADGGWRIVYEGAARVRREHLRGIPYSARARLSLR